jgi:hypothetical protein
MAIELIKQNAQLNLQTPKDDEIELKQALKGDKGDKGDRGDTGLPFTYDMFTEEQLEALRGEKGDKGDAGFSPIVETEQHPAGYVVAITDEEQKHLMILYHGKDGENGADGFSPTVDVTDVEEGHKLTITDKEGTKEVIIKDGESGGTSGGMVLKSKHYSYIDDAEGWARTDIYSSGEVWLYIAEPLPEGSIIVDFDIEFCQTTYTSTELFTEAVLVSQADRIVIHPRQQPESNWGGYIVAEIIGIDNLIYEDTMQWLGGVTGITLYYYEGVSE